MEKRLSGKEGDLASQVTLAVFRADLSPVVSCSPIEKKRDQSGSRARSVRGQSLPFCFPPFHDPRGPFGHASRVLRV